MSIIEDVEHDIELLNIVRQVTPHMLSAAKKCVTDVVNVDGLSTADKHARVKADLKIIFKDASSILLNLVIEMAVLWLNSKGIPA